MLKKMFFEIITLCELSQKTVRNISQNQKKKTEMFKQHFAILACGATKFKCIKPNCKSQNSIRLKRF